jgi:hypothetical protein
VISASEIRELELQPWLAKMRMVLSSAAFLVLAERFGRRAAQRRLVFLLKFDCAPSFRSL